MPWPRCTNVVGKPLAPSINFAAPVFLLAMTHVVHVYIVATMLTELLYPLQASSTPLHFAAMGGHTACVERILSTPGIDVNIKNVVSCCIEC